MCFRARAAGLPPTLQMGKERRTRLPPLRLEARWEPLALRSFHKQAAHQPLSQKGLPFLFCLIASHIILETQHLCAVPTRWAPGPPAPLHLGCLPHASAVLGGVPEGGVPCSPPLNIRLMFAKGWLCELGKQKFPDPKRQDTEWKTIFAINLTHKTLHPEYVNSTCKSITKCQAIKEKNRQDAGQALHKEETHVAVGHMKMCLASSYSGRCIMDHKDLP